MGGRRGAGSGVLYRFCVSSERVLQQSREFGVAEGHVLRPRRDQRFDDIAQCGQRQIYRFRLIQTLTRSAGPLLTLRSGQIDLHSSSSTAHAQQRSARGRVSTITGIITATAIAIAIALLRD
jgi:hypothetical protein